MNMSDFIGAFIAMCAALVVVILVHPKVIAFAKKHNIVDNPDARKLQRVPVPVMGGVAVYFGLAIGLCVAGLFMNIISMLPMVIIE